MRELQGGKLANPTLHMDLESQSWLCVGSLNCPLYRWVREWKVLSCLGRVYSMVVSISCSCCWVYHSTLSFSVWSSWVCLNYSDTLVSFVYSEHSASSKLPV